MLVTQAYGSEKYVYLTCFFENVIKRIFHLFIILTITFCQSTFIATCESQEKAKKTLLEYGSYLVSQVVKVCRMHR